MALRQIVKTIAGSDHGLDKERNPVWNRRDGSQIVADADATSGQPAIYTRTKTGSEAGGSLLTVALNSATGNYEADDFTAESMASSGIAVNSALAFVPNGFAFPKTKRALARVLSGGGRMKVGFIGDSTTTGAGGGTSGTTNIVGARPYNMPSQFAKRCATFFDVPGNVAVTEGNVIGASATIPQFDPRVTYGGSTSVSAPVGFMTVGGQLVNITSGGSITFAPGVATDTCIIGYVRNSGLGTLTPSLDDASAVSPASLNTAGATACLSQTFTYTKGVRTITLTGSVATSYIQFILCYDSTAPGIDVFALSRWGGVANDWTTTGQPWNPGTAGSTNAWSTLGLDLAVIQLTINDASAGTSLATYTAGLQSIITKLQATTAAPDIALMSGWPSSTSVTSSAQTLAFQGACRDLAAANGLPYIAFGEKRVVSYANYSDWYMADGIHPLATGYADEGDYLMRLINSLR